MKEIFAGTLPWFIAGPLIGLIVPALLIIDNNAFGVSSTLRDFCTAVIPRRFSYFNYPLKDVIWRNILILGVFLGGSLAWLIWGNDSIPGVGEASIESLKAYQISVEGGLVPLEIFSWSNVLSFQGFMFIILGGFLVGFGTRWADGCTSGHAITGLAMFSKASFIAVIGFFVGGLISVHLIFPLIF